jgi:rare lipoprotein A (peptidoglycan hydrolase)
LDAFRKHALCAGLLACALAAAAPVLASAAPSASVQQQAASAKARIDGMQSELSSAMSEYDSAASGLATTRAQLAANRKELDSLKGSMDVGQERLAAACVFLYRTDGNGFTEALLTAPSLEVFANRLLALSRIASRDAQLIGKLKRDRLAAEKLAVTLAEREAQQAAQVQAVAVRRAKAQFTLADQQRYADSLSASVASALQSSSTDTGSKSPVPAPKPVSRHATAWATVEGRNGKYAVLGDQPRSYSPSGITFDGVATWYGNVRSNMHTASGRAFDENEFTCAHKTLPFGTRIAVTFRGKRVIVTVTDRGPYGRGRVIDLTKRAAAVIGLRSAGVGRVHCEVVRPK